MQAYEIDNRGWKWVPVEDILRDTTASVDFYTNMDWEMILEEKCADTGFMHLVWSIMEYGWLSAVGWTGTKITEGHHRICAAILLCEDLIPVTDHGTSYYTSGPANTAHSNWDDPQPLNLWEL
jgi:hypothetical protein